MNEHLNADFHQPVVLGTQRLQWVASPLPGVDRRMLDRVGGEVARATSIVRYAPGSTFSTHVHELGEEFLVLEGTFSDEHGDYPAGSYVRNPPGSSHSPRSHEGCTLFVKLRQFDLGDTRQVVVDTRAASFAPTAQAGVSSLSLHEYGEERVRLLRLAPGASLPAHDNVGGEEILVLAGGYRDERAHHGDGAWIRNPPGAGHPMSSDDGALLYVKTGHLPPAAS